MLPSGRHSLFFNRTSGLSGRHRAVCWKHPFVRKVLRDSSSLECLVARAPGVGKNNGGSAVLNAAFLEDHG